MPRPESSKPKPATKILVQEPAINDDELPIDPETSLVTNQYVQFAEFLAYVRDSRISVGGELHITIAVPYEHKYDAMPLTDARGITFIMQCHRPMTQGEIEYKKQQGLIDWTVEEGNGVEHE